MTTWLLSIGANKFHAHKKMWFTIEVLFLAQLQVILDESGHLINQNETMNYSFDTNM